jgi:hypothetical protein
MRSQAQAFEVGLDKAARVGRGAVGEAAGAEDGPTLVAMTKSAG